MISWAPFVMGVASKTQFIVSTVTRVELPSESLWQKSRTLCHKIVFRHGERSIAISIGKILLRTGYVTSIPDITFDTPQHDHLHSSSLSSSFPFHKQL